MSHKHDRSDKDYREGRKEDRNHDRKDHHRDDRDRDKARDRSPVRHSSSSSQWRQSSPRRSPKKRTWEDWSVNSKWEHDTWERSSWDNLPVAPSTKPLGSPNPPGSRFSPKPKVDAWIRNEAECTTIPESFISDEMYVDSTLRLGTPLMKRVVATEWSQKHGIANMPIEKVSVLSTIYGGYENWCLRHLSMGRACYFNMVKSFERSAFMYQLNFTLKDTSIEALAQKWNNACTDVLPHETDDHKKELIKKFADFIATNMQQGSNDTQLFSRVAKLEAELADANIKLLQTGKKGTNTCGFGQFSRGSGEQFLQIDCPVAVSPKEVQAWSMKTLGRSKHKDIPKIMSAIKALAQESIPNEAARFEALRIALADYGLPITLAAKIDKDQAYKMMAALHIRTQD